MEARFGEGGFEFGFAEAEPFVGIELAGLFKAMLCEIEDGDAPAGLEDAMGFGEGSLGVEGVVEGLRKEQEVDAVGVDGQLLHVSEAVVDVFDALFFGVGLGDRDHTGGAVDGDDAIGSLGEEKGKGSFAGPEISDDHGRHKTEEGFGDGFPGFAGDVVAAVASGDVVEEGTRLVAALFEDALKGGLIAGGFGDLSPGLKQELVKGSGTVFAASAVEIVFARSAVLDQSGLFELREMRGDGALAHGEDFLQLGDGELFLFDQQEDAKPVGVGHDAQNFHN